GVLRRDLPRIGREDKGRGPRCQQNRSSALSRSPSALPSPVVGASSLARLWYWGWRLSAFPPVEAALDAAGDTGAGFKSWLPCSKNVLQPGFWKQGPKLIFRIQKSPWGSSD